MARLEFLPCCYLAAIALGEEMGVDTGRYVGVSGQEPSKKRPG
jgi:hypothetical protein